MPNFPGIYRGKVHSTNDPERQHRLLIIVPQVGGSHDPLDWAMPCFPFLTQPVLTSATIGDHGAHTHVPTATGKVTLQVPKVGSPVWVMFEAGDARRPVWIGTWRF